MDPNDQSQNNAAEQPTQDDAEWGRAFDEFSANKGLNPAIPVDDKKGGADANSNNAAGTDAANKPADDAGGDADAAKAGQGDDDATKQQPGAEEDTNATIRETRQIQRELEEDRKQTIQDVREKLYPDLKMQLTDMDGDPLEKPEDVMKLRNPNTNKAFTREEATQYLLEAQQYLAKQNDEAQSRIEQIAEVNINIKDEASAVRARWGKFLTDPKNADLAKETWADYQATLKTDPNTGIILEAPVSMERFYNRTLAGYAAQAETSQNATQQTQAAEQARLAAEAKAARLQNREDRGDITSNGRTQLDDPEDKEWSNAFKQHYEGKV
jgi:hypothetical protein